MAVMGVRISWLMFARNSLFRRLASCAAAKRDSISIFISSSACRAEIPRISRWL
jgi:hypothetical protein